MHVRGTYTRDSQCNRGDRLRGNRSSHSFIPAGHSRRVRRASCGEGVAGTPVWIARRTGRNYMASAAQPKYRVVRDTVIYACASCGAELRSPLMEAGTDQRCPECQTSHTVPGQAERIERDAQRLREQQRQEQAAEAQLRAAAQRQE